MSVDPDDLTPGAISRIGAKIISHGVPSQPGNMTLVAYAGDTAILGIPGAAISLPTTMFDVLLPQIFAGDKFTKEQLVALGDGGLCQLCKSCHFPNCTFGRY
jgi:molybdopterin biosynthesis enzyme